MKNDTRKVINNENTQNNYNTYGCFTAVSICSGICG